MSDTYRLLLDIGIYVAMGYILVAASGLAQSLFYPRGYIKPCGWDDARHISQVPWRVLILIGSAEELNNFNRT